MTSIQCRCGSVKLTFPTRQPVLGLECCCVDCYGKNLWSCRESGIPAPPGLEAHGKGKPLDLRYWPNRLQVVGKGKLAFNKLRAGAMSTNMVASCCKTLLCVDNPFYQQNVVLTFPEFCQPCGVDGELPRPLLRVMTQDWPEREMSKLPKLAWDGRENDIMSQVFDVFGTPPPDGPGETFQQLVAGATGGIEILGLPEGRNSFTLRRRRRRLLMAITGAAATLAFAAACRSLLRMRVAASSSTK